MDSALDHVAAHKHAQELRDTWQVRALIETQWMSIGTVMLSVIAHNYDDAMPFLMRAAFPGFRALAPPALISAGKIDHSGRIVADMAAWNGRTIKDYVLYPTERAMRDDFRRLADRMRLVDKDRIEMFKAAQRWVVADRRLDPTMDPRDPDAKRLAVH